MSDHEHDYADLAAAQQAADAFAIGDIAYTDIPTPELPPALQSEPMVVFTLRISVSTYQAIQEEAQRLGVKPSTVGRDWLDQQRTDLQQDSGEMVRLADVERALRSLRRAS